MAAVVTPHVKDSGHFAHENFARRERRNNANPHFPIEAQRSYCWLDKATHTAGKAMTQPGAGFVIIDLRQLFSICRGCRRISGKNTLRNRSAFGGKFFLPVSASRIGSQKP